MASDGRKSLMITKELHEKLMNLANKYDVSQPEMVEALMKSADSMRLQAALSEITSQRKLTQAQAAQKRQVLERALAGMTVEQVEALMATVKSK